MRKAIISQERPDNSAAANHRQWLDIESLAQVELTSEDPNYPIELSLLSESEQSWRAQHPGRQTIRLRFDQPQTISTIHLVFEENERERTQEFLLRWSAGESGVYQEIVRQQYHFSPPNCSCELEHYSVDLKGVIALELMIIPDISRGDARASLKQFRLAG
ncbi:MAG: hypothetical protein HY272_01450 [Gammaproteobacteria bacterium]|nr:hypothetical protein [Gammaproteobacteria bacterium]